MKIIETRHLSVDLESSLDMCSCGVIGADRDPRCTAKGDEQFGVR